MASATAAEADSHGLLGEAQGLMTLKVRSPGHRDRVLRLRSSKCTIGSDPSCTLRLVAAGVRPFHCLILRGAAGTFIRRWSPGTCLNGAGFTEARLEPGDRLDIGPIELEVLESSLWDRRRAASAPEGSRASEARAADLETPLSAAQQASRDVPAADRHDSGDKKYAGAIAAAARAAREAERRHGEVRQQQWAARERRLREQLEEAREGLREADANLEHARSQSAEQERRIQEMSRELARGEQATVVLQHEREQIAADQSRWRDSADTARQELQQERAEHQRVRNEWYVDRQDLQRQLAARFEELQTVRSQHAQEMQDAETLIHALQREGRQLLDQLEETRQLIRCEREKGEDPKRDQHNVTGITDPAPARQQVGTKGAQRMSAPSTEMCCSPATESHDSRPADMPPAADARQREHEPSAFGGDHTGAPGSAEAELPQDRPVAGEGLPDLESPTLLLQPDPLVPLMTRRDSRAADAVPMTGNGPTVALAAHPIPAPPAAAPGSSPGRADAGDETTASGVNETPGEPQKSESDDDAGVIQKYMERLLQRVSSGAKPDLVGIPCSTALASPAGAPAASHDPMARGSGERPALDARTAGAPPASARPAQVQAQWAVDLLTMRELANRSAKGAIQACDQRRIKVMTISELIVASVCLVCSGLAVAMSPSPTSPGIVVGVCLGLSCGGVALLRGAYLYVCYRRVRRSGADGAN